MLHQQQRQSITQRIDPKIIQANSILQLTSLELLQSVENELMENPALDTLEDGGCAGDCLDPDACPYCLARKAQIPNDSSDPDSLDSDETYTDYNSSYESPHNDSDDDYDPISNLESEVTLQEHLRNLYCAAVPPEAYAIGEYLINCLDDRGYLDGAVKDIAVELNVIENEVLQALKVIQSFDPPGIGARSLQECMLIQLQYLMDEDSETSDQKLLQSTFRMVRDNFELVTLRRYTKLARFTSISVEEAKACIEYIRTRLNPFPASQFRPPWDYKPMNSRASVRPDVVVRRTELGYEVEVLGSDHSLLCINSSYRDAYNHMKTVITAHNDEEKKHISDYVERAELFIRNINQRRHTLRQITKCIIDCQTGFLETGSRQFLRPLTRTGIAKILHIHESTVSRATSNKFIQLPNQEVVGFDIFFNSSLSVKDVIEQIIHQEDSSNPLSDKQIVELLRDKGVDVARRTIVKYRESQMILSSTHRRR